MNKERKYWGIGAYHNGRPVDKAFVDNGIACVGWNKADAEPLHRVLERIKEQDVVFIKSHTPSKGLFIKAVGIVTDSAYKDRGYGFGVGVDWVWPKPYLGEKRDWEKPGKIDDKYNVRSITLFEEFNTDIISLLNSKLPK